MRDFTCFLEIVAKHGAKRYSSVHYIIIIIIIIIIVIIMFSGKVGHKGS